MDVTAMRRRRILQGANVEVRSAHRYPIAVNDQHPTLPYVTTHEIHFTIAGRTETVPHNFHFDGASIPAIAWFVRGLLLILACRWLYRRWSWKAVLGVFQPLNTVYRNLIAGCWHDWRYETQFVPKAIADAEFEAVLLAEGESKWIAKAMRIAVEIFGHSAWNRHAAENKRRKERVKRVIDAAEDQ